MEKGKFETQKKVTELSEKVQEQEIRELEEKKAQLLKQLENVDVLIGMKRRGVEGSKEELKKQEIGEKISAWKEQQKKGAREILKKFFEREEEKKRTVAIDADEQEKLIHEALAEREAERVLKESPAYEDFKAMRETTQKELKKPGQLEIVEVEYLEDNELPDAVETSVLTDSKKLESSANRLSELCDKLEEEMKEKGIDVDKMELSVAERMKFSIKSLFSKKLRNAYKSWQMARVEEDVDRTEAQRLRLSVTDPEEYKKKMMIDAAKVIAQRHAAIGGRIKEPLSSSGWVKRI